MPSPNYRDGSIVNLVASIQAGLGARPRHPALKILPAKEISRAKNVVLLVLDGLGYEFLMRASSCDEGKNGSHSHFFLDHLLGRITSVFPSATAPAITAYHTGLVPAEHGVTGWFMYLKEVGMVVLPLPFVPRAGGGHLGPDLAKFVFNAPSVFSGIKHPCFRVMGSSIVNSDFTSAQMIGSKPVAYQRTKGASRAAVKREFDAMLAGVRKVLASSSRIFSSKKSSPRGLSSRKSFVYAYWPEFDSICHEYSPWSLQALDHFRMMESSIEKFAASLGKDTILLICADHGQIDTPRSRYILVDDHPVIAESLALPLCGEGRAPFLYVKPSRRKEFERYVRKKLGHACALHKSADLLRKGLFGPPARIHPSFLDRVGDYVLLMKENYTLVDRLVTENWHFHAGSHGGLSREEIFVPLIVVKGQ